MRVLAIAEFDPAGVLDGHRRALRAMGVDYRVAVSDIYLDTGRLTDPPDWHEGEMTADAVEQLRAFAAEADILQFHPAISQPYTYESDVPKFAGDTDDRPFAGIDWRQFHRAKRVAYFHGSRNAAANAAAYANDYHRRGFVLAASTLDYVETLQTERVSPENGVRYLPPVVDLHGRPRAPLRQDGEPLRVIQCPTDPEFCHTTVLERVCRTVGDGIALKVVTKKPHWMVLRAKAAFHAGFDHMRGSFSVNTWEHAALGLVPLVKIKDSARDWLSKARFALPPFPQIDNELALERVLRDLAGDPAYTRAMQVAAYDWSQSFPWDPASLTLYLKGVYAGLLAG